MSDIAPYIAAKIIRCVGIATPKTGLFLHFHIFQVLAFQGDLQYCLQYYPRTRGDSKFAIFPYFVDFCSMRPGE